MLSYDTVQQIGNLIGMLYTNFNGRCTIPDNASGGLLLMSGSAKIIESNKNTPSLLILLV